MPTRRLGVSAEEVDVCELHDCFSANELITYEALGFAEEGHGHELVDAEATTYGGSGPVVNPSGGLISKGHPLGATGLAQCSELTWQLRGTAGQAPGRRREGRAPAQHRPRRRGRRERLQAGPRLTERTTATMTTTSHSSPSASPTSRRTSRPRSATSSSASSGRRSSARRRTNHYEELHNQEIYEKLAELGWLGVGIDEAYGGSGGGMVDQLHLPRGDDARPGPDRRLRRLADRRRRVRALRHRGAEAGDPEAASPRAASRRSRCPSPRRAPTWGTSRARPSARTAASS